MKIIAIIIELDDGAQITLHSAAEVDQLIAAIDAAQIWKRAYLRLDYNWSERLKDYEAGNSRSE